MEGRSTKSALLALVSVLAVAVGSTARAQESEAEPTGPGGMSIEEISRMLDNPLGNLWMIFMENGVLRYRGNPAQGWKTVNTFLMQPVLPLPLTKNWNLISRPIIPIMTAPKFDVSARRFGDCPGNCDPGNAKRRGLLNIGSDPETELGDTILWSMLSPAEPPKFPDGSSFIWGIGPSFRLPTATEDQFGSEKWSMGPSSIVLRLAGEGQKVTAGLFQQHLFSFAGKSSRDNVRMSQFQPIYWYSLPVEGEWSIGGFPLITVNYEAKGDNKVSLPLELGFSTTFFLGPMPIRIGAAAQYYAVRPDDYGPRYGFKFFVVPVIPSLVKNPIFGTR